MSYFFTSSFHKIHFPNYMEKLASHLSYFSISFKRFMFCTDIFLTQWPKGKKIENSCINPNFFLNIMCLDFFIDVIQKKITIKPATSMLWSINYETIAFERSKNLQLGISLSAQSRLSLIQKKWDGTRKNNFSILLTLKEEKKNFHSKFKLFFYRDGR